MHPLYRALLAIPADRLWVQQGPQWQAHQGIQSLLKSPARLSTKLAAALLEAGWCWSQIEADAELSDRTIRRARREIDLGPPAQVGQALTRAQIFSL